LSISAISRRYAKALVEMGAERKMVEQYGEELGKVNAVFGEFDSLRLLMESPTFAPEGKSAIMADIEKSLAISEGMHNFLGLLLAKDRLQYLPQIENDYRTFADELSGILRARITTAAEMPESQKEGIRAAMERQTGKQVELKSTYDPSLLGGIQVEIAGKVFDSSLKTQLKRIEETLKKG
jgi:F-type H+-transporting ATPase subunit delta